MCLVVRVCVKTKMNYNCKVMLTPMFIVIACCLEVVQSKVNISTQHIGGLGHASFKLHAQRLLWTKNVVSPVILGKQVTTRP